MERAVRYPHPAGWAGADPERGTGSSVGGGGERLAGGRVAGAGAPTAVSAAASDRARRPGRRRDQTARHRPALRTGAIPGPYRRADGAPQVLADLRSLPGVWAGGRFARVRRWRAPDYRLRLAVLLHRRPRRTGPVNAGQPDQ